MSTIRQRLLSLIDGLSEINNPPPMPPALAKALDGYLKALNEAKDKYKEEEKWRNLLAELANSREAQAREKLQQLAEKEFKAFCLVNSLKMLRGKASKKVKGKIIQKARDAKPAKGKKPAQAAIPEIKDPDTFIPAISAREATIESILTLAERLKQQATT